MSLFFQPELQEEHFWLNKEESIHCIRVMRKKAGDSIMITDGKGTLVKAIILSPDATECTFEVCEKTFEQNTPYQIHIAIAPTKNSDRMEWFIEKAVEIGIHKITFIGCQNSERYKLKTDRLLKKAVSAMKQSQRVYLPEISELTKLASFIPSVPEGEKFITYMDSGKENELVKTAPIHGHYTVLIGPEGGFTREETEMALNNNFRLVRMGKYRLRTETAGIVACTILNQINNNS